MVGGVSKSVLLKAFTAAWTPVKSPSHVLNMLQQRCTHEKVQGIHQAHQNGAKDDGDSRDRKAPMEPTGKFYRTDLEKHKEREYEGVYWTGEGVRYDSRLDTGLGEEDSGYVTGKGTPVPRPEALPMEPKKE